MNRKLSKKLVSWLLAFAIILTSVGIANMPASAAGKTVIKVTNLPANTLTLKKGTTFTLRVNATTNKVKTGVTYSTSNKKIVTVTSAGKLKGIKNGKATITIKSKVNKKVTKKIYVTVGIPVTKVSLNKTTKEIVPNEKFTLKATVSPKSPSNKGIVWSSSNAKVAKVSNKGVVTGVKLGKAKITATAKDGSGKKAVCTVNVVKPVKIAKLNIVKKNEVKLTLNRKYRLTKNNISIAASTGGSMSNGIPISSIYTSDNLVYTVRYVVNEGYITNLLKVKATVSNVPGGKTSKEAKYNFDKTSNVRYGNIVTTTAYQYISESLSPTGLKGYFSWSATGLPAGVKCKLFTDGLSLVGYPTTPGKYKTVVTCTDEWGNICKCINYILVAGENKMYAAANPTVYYANDDEAVNVGCRVYAIKKKSGFAFPKYSYEIVGENYGLSVSNGYVSGALKPGSYSVKVKVSSDADYCYATVPIYVIKRAKVSFVAKDKAGSVLPRMDVLNKYVTYTVTSISTTSDYTSAQSNVSVSKDSETGYYYAYLSPGKYKITFNYNGYTETGEYTVSSTTKTITRTMSLYEVSLPALDGNPLYNMFYDEWKDDNAVSWSIAKASVIIVPAGKIKLTSIRSSYVGIYDAVIEADISSNCTVNPKLTKSTNDSYLGEIKPGQTKTFTVNTILPSNKIQLIVPETRSYKVTITCDYDLQPLLFYRDSNGSSYPTWFTSTVTQTLDSSKLNFLQLNQVKCPGGTKITVKFE